jgi:arylsulfatase A-like enzyme
VDERLGRLFSRLDQIDRWRNTTVVVVGTHGIGLGEGGLYLDHGMLNDVDLRVPWILRPGEDVRCERGLRTRALASLLDVAPTLLDLHGISTPAEMQGVSQVPALRSRLPELQGTGAPREHAVARCGFQAGLAVIDATHCYERTMPWAVRSSDLAISWYGTQIPREQVEREVLHDRATDDIGHEHSPASSDPDRAAALRAVGDAWSAATEDLRRRLQDVTWPEPPSPSWMAEQFVAGASAGSPP